MGNISRIVSARGRLAIIALALCALGGGTAVAPVAKAGPAGDFDIVPKVLWMNDPSPSTPGHAIAMSIAIGDYTTLAGTFELFESATVPVTGTPIATVTVSGSAGNTAGNTTADVTSSSRFSVKFTSGNASFDSKNFENLQAKCAQGRYSSDGYGPCTLAPIGAYVEFEQQTFAIPCPPGTFQALTGQMLCNFAPPGSYTNESGAAAAKLCPVGSYQPDSMSISCLLADIGYYVDIEGSIAQFACPSGLTNTVTGSAVCDVSAPTTTTTTTTSTTTTTVPTLCCAPPTTTTTIATTTKRAPKIPAVAKKVTLRRSVAITLKKGRNANGLATTVSSRSKTCTVRKTTKGYTVTGVSRGVCSVTIKVKGNSRYSSATVRRTITVTK